MRELLKDAMSEIIRLHRELNDSRGIHATVNVVAMMIEDRLESIGDWVSWNRVTHEHTDIWFWWNGEQSFPVNIMRDSDGRFFASVGQWGWTRAQFLEEMGGLWCQCVCPQPPDSANV